MRKNIAISEQSEHVTVGEYLETLNTSLKESRGRVIGEVCNLKLYGGRSYMYFSVKDTQREALMNCFMWKRDYLMCGVELEDGLEVVINGYPKIYVPNGSMSFQTEAVELVGEGALKKAYDKLKEKLEREGVLSDARKRPIPEYPQKIGVITSRDGAVLSDFTSNIGKFGYRIQFVNSRVEGQTAIRDLLSAVRTLKKADLDVLVIMRGGGSLESFAAFNNEMLVREIASFAVPVIAGIGHDKDISLVALAADNMVSTPTAVAQQLNATWEQALLKVRILERDLFGSFEQMLSHKRLFLLQSAALMKDSFNKIFELFKELQVSFRLGIKNIDQIILNARHFLDRSQQKMSHRFQKMIAITEHFLNLKHKEIQLLDPQRQLKLGYSILRHNGMIVKSTKGLKTGENLHIQMHDGALDAEIKKLN